MLSLVSLKTAAWLSASLDAAIGVGVLWAFRWQATRRGRPVTIGAPAVMLAALASFACFGLTVFVAVGSNVLNVFGLIRLAYINTAIVPAALGLALLGLAMRGNPARVPVHIRILAVLLLLPLAICAYASFVAPYQLRVERANVPVAGLTDLSEPIRIAVLADIQTDQITAHERDAVDRVLSTQPDVIVLPGDFFQGDGRQFRTQLPAFRRLLARLEAPGGVYACEGNIDHPSRLKELFERTPIRWLRNETAIVNVRGRTLAIAGVEWNYRSAAAQQVCRNMRYTDTDARILLCHTPDGALRTEPDDRIDLVISGHTHGGQVVIPGFGPPLTFSRVPRDVAAGGLHRLGHQLLYVSRGVGFERGATPPMRLFCPPEVSVLSLSSRQ